MCRRDGDTPPYNPTPICRIFQLGVWGSVQVSVLNLLWSGKRGVLVCSVSGAVWSLVNLLAVVFEVFLVRGVY